MSFQQSQACDRDPNLEKGYVMERAIVGDFSIVKAWKAGWKFRFFSILTFQRKPSNSRLVTCAWQHIPAMSQRIWLV